MIIPPEATPLTALNVRCRACERGLCGAEVPDTLCKRLESDGKACGIRGIRRMCAIARSQAQEDAS